MGGSDNGNPPYLHYGDGSSILPPSTSVTVGPSIERIRVRHVVDKRAFSVGGLGSLAVKRYSEVVEREVRPLPEAREDPLTLNREAICLPVDLNGPCPDKKDREPFKRLDVYYRPDPIDDVTEGSNPFLLLTAGLGPS